MREDENRLHLFIFLITVPKIAIQCTLLVLC